MPKAEVKIIDLPKQQTNTIQSKQNSQTRSNLQHHNQILDYQAAHNNNQFSFHPPQQFERKSSLKGFQQMSQLKSSNKNSINSMSNLNQNHDHRQNQIQQDVIQQIIHRSQNQKDHRIVDNYEVDLFQLSNQKPMQRSIINSPNAENRLRNYMNPPTLQEIDEQSSQNDFKNFRANFQGINTQNFQGRGMFTPTNNHPMNSNFDSSQLSPQNIDQRGKNTHRKRMVELNSPSQNQIHTQPYTRKASQLTLESNRSGTTQGGGQQSFLNVNMNQQSIFNNNNSINVQSYNIASIDQIVETIYDSLDKLKSYLMISIKDQESRLSKEYEEKFDKIHQRLLELEKNQSIAGNAQQNVISPLKSSMRSFDHMLNDRGIVQQHSDVKIHSNKFVYPSMITVKSGQTELSQLRGMQNTTHQTTNASCSAITNAKYNNMSPKDGSAS